jgi:hypothetical protein
MLCVPTYETKPEHLKEEYSHLEVDDEYEPLGNRAFEMEIEEMPFHSCHRQPNVSHVVERPEGMFRQDASETVDDERVDEVEPPEVCSAVETSENIEDEGTDEENLQQVANISGQVTGDMIRQATFETVEDDVSELLCNSESCGELELSRQESPRSRSSKDWDLVDIADPEHEEEQDTWDLVDIAGPEHREEQDNEECKLPHSTIEGEKQALPPVATDSWYLNRSSNDTRNLVGATGPDFSETPDKGDHGPPSRIMERREQPMADTQCIKKEMRNQLGGKHSPDTGGTGECMAEGADTGGIESCK